MAISMGNLSQLVLLFVIIGIVAAVGLKVNSSMQASFTNTSAEYLAIQNATEGISNITAQLGLLGLIVIFSVIIFVVIRHLGGAMGGV